MLLESDFFWPSQLVDQRGLDTGQYEANWRKLIAAINAAQAEMRTWLFVSILIPARLS